MLKFVLLYDVCRFLRHISNIIMKSYITLYINVHKINITHKKRNITHVCYAIVMYFSVKRISTWLKNTLDLDSATLSA